MSDNLKIVDSSNESLQSPRETGLDGLLGYHLKRAFNVIRNDLARTLEPFELRMLTFSALATIAKNEGLRQFELADALDIERPNLVVIIDELEGRDLITREKVPTDRRAYALFMTDEGRRLYKRASKAVVEHEKRLFQNLSEDEQKQFLKTLNMIEGLDQK